MNPIQNNRPRGKLQYNVLVAGAMALMTMTILLLMLMLQVLEGTA